MRKHKLHLDDLAVETFEPVPADGAGRGTVFGRQEETGVLTCVTCVRFLCYASRVQTNCCTQNPDANCSLPLVC